MIMVSVGEQETRCGELACKVYSNSHTHTKHKRQGLHHRVLPLPFARSDVFVYFVVFFSHIPSLLSSFRSDSGSSSWQQLDRHVRSVKYLCGMKPSHTHTEFSCAGLELFITTRSLLVSEPQDSWSINAAWLPLYSIQLTGGNSGCCI